jgi:hypothetical protein
MVRVVPLTGEMPRSGKKARPTQGAKGRRLFASARFSAAGGLYSGALVYYTLLCQQNRLSAILKNDPDFLKCVERKK